MSTNYRAPKTVCSIRHTPSPWEWTRYSNLTQIGPPKIKNPLFFASEYLIFNIQIDLQIYLFSRWRLNLLGSRMLAFNISPRFNFITRKCQLFRLIAHQFCPIQVIKCKLRHKARTRESWIQLRIWVVIGRLSTIKNKMYISHKNSRIKWSKDP